MQFRSVCPHCDEEVIFSRNPGANFKFKCSCGGFVLLVGKSKKDLEAFPCDFEGTILDLNEVAANGC